jgi:glycosyltransferase involved in cell wall biosynthesis
MIGNFLSDTGTRSVTEDLAAQLSAQGWKVRSASDQRPRLLRLWDMLVTTWRSRSTCSVALVDVYSGAAIFWAIAVCIVWSTSGKPFILSLHGGNLPQFSARWPRLVRRLLRSAAAVTAPSQYLLKQMAPYRADIRLHPNGLSLAHHTFTHRRDIAPRLVWVRSFHDTYNPSMAVHVVAQLSEEFPDATLTMIGPDKGDGSLEAARAAAAMLGVADRVRFVGRVPKSEVPAWLDKADVFLNTTNVDNTPLSVLEAMASGLCVVTTNVGGLPYLLENGTDALLVSSNDAGAMADAVKHLIRNRDHAGRLSAAAHAKATEFDWSAVIPKWDRLLTACATRTESGWKLLPNEQ